MKRCYPLLVILFLFIMMGCDQEEEDLPVIQFKTGAGYTSSDATVKKDTVLTVEIIVEKTENDLKTYNVSAAYDKATTTTTVQNFVIPDDEESPYEKDVTFKIGNQAGVERYYFTITDSDENIVTKTLTFTVQ